MEEKIKEVLKEVNPEIISYTGENIFEAGLLDSLQTVNLISGLESAFNIEIDADYLVEENFMSIDAIVKMIQKITR